MSRFEITEVLNENSDQKPSRFDYVRYDEQAQARQNQAKALHQGLEAAIEELPGGRAKDLAVTKLEECYMWVGKAIRDEQILRNGVAELMEQRKDG